MSRLKFGPMMLGTTIILAAMLGCAPSSQKPFQKSFSLSERDRIEFRAAGAKVNTARIEVKKWVQSNQVDASREISMAFYVRKLLESSEVSDWQLAGDSIRVGPLPEPLTGYMLYVVSTMRSRALPRRQRRIVVQALIDRFDAEIEYGIRPQVYAFYQKLSIQLREPVLVSKVLDAARARPLGQTLNPQYCSLLRGFSEGQATVCRQVVKMQLEEHKSRLKNMLGE